MGIKRVIKAMTSLPLQALLALLFLVSACSQIGADKPAPLLAPGPALAPAPAANFTLTVLHTNDTHSSYGGTTDKGLTCYAAMCAGGRGGYVRLDQAVRAIRRDNPDALFLDAGDIFQGTLFWTLHKERMPMALVDRMGYQALIPGNHEFDAGWPVWLRLVESLKTPVLAANISFDPRPNSPAINKILPYRILERNGRKIGIVGLVTEETPEKSSPGPGISFSNAQKALETAVKELTAQHVNIIIALTHLGLANDRLLARAVNGVDIIVGGHSHSLLSNVRDRVEGPYPVVEKRPDGAPVLVVTASTACIYLGRLDVDFDDKGIVKGWRGEPVLLDQATLASLKAPKPDAELLQLIDGFAAPVQKMMREPIGTINAAGKEGRPLEDPNVMECRRLECLSGNIVADALRAVPFGETDIALVNSGALRASLPGGLVAPGHVLATLPFQNTPLTVKMPGAVLWQALEHGIAKYGEGEGSFLQVSGLRYAFKVSQPPGQRISKVEVQSRGGQWRLLDKSAIYQVVTLDFTARGGDGFAMFPPLPWQEGDKLANDVLRVYLKQHSPVKARQEGRITIQY
ncbi:MAG: bifunctional metallophosphatase/5'-nucleotidase [Desulfobulbaceae bacterium]|jgi:5'-nucleotidase|nr:bifunctional metallophosphatase/5'-nucleotidase [Desulfobulbaceae bacterium]